MTWVAVPGPGEEPEDLLALTELIAALPELDRTVIVLRFFHDLDQDSIAARIGYSQMHASRLLRRALASLRAQLLDPLSSPVQQHGARDLAATNDSSPISPG